MLSAKGRSTGLMTEALFAPVELVRGGIAFGDRNSLLAMLVKWQELGKERGVALYQDCTIEEKATGSGWVSPPG